ncbi:MAG: hypothetical protein PHQ96_08485 [Candidatus Omnitrophica bacterium]|nr:hypothetical protein [Candidatus Omnitrophota bacterium]
MKYKMGFVRISKHCFFIISFIVLFFSRWFASAVELDFSLPQGTEIIEQGKKTATATESITISRYRSELSKGQIMNFYERELSTRGWKKFQPITGDEKRYQDTLLYVKDGINTFTVVISPYLENEKILYNIIIAEPTKIVALRETFNPPRQLDFMPVPDAATEFVYNTYYTPMIGLGYLTHDSVESVGNFYLSNMSKFGWILQNNETKEGMYSLSEWIKIVDPFTKAVPNLEAIGFASLVPPLSVKGRTLTFAQGKKSCTITIYKFDDILAKAVGTMFDMSFMEEHGTTLICVYYFYDEKK